MDTRRIKPGLVASLWWVAATIWLAHPAAGQAERPAPPHCPELAGTPVASGHYTRSEHPYRIPDFTLLNQEGEEVSLAEVLDPSKPVMVNFLFVTCTTICPVQAASFTQVQRELGPEANGVAMVSFTIDPDFDTPAELKAYGERYLAGPQWQFLTGTRDQIHRIQKAFDAYAANKMSHLPLTFLRAPGEGPWIRIHGLASASDLVAEYRQIQGAEVQVPGP